MKLLHLTTAAAALCFACAAHAQTATYITDFTKTDNIYTNLNEQFPHTDNGTGVPGSSVGTVNASFVFNPSTFNPGNMNNTDYVNNGVVFDLTSNATGQDFSEVGPAGFGVSTLTLPINVAGATNVYLLASAFDGTSANVTFTGSGGATETFSNIGLPDFNGGGSVNTSSGGLTDQTVYRVTDTGAGGSGNSTTGAYNSYDLVELGFTLGSQFAGQTLQSADVTSNGYETLILGATVVSPSAVVSGVPEPSIWILMFAGIGGIGLMLRRARGKMGRAVTSAAA
jgi:hypothetical protein